MSRIGLIACALAASISVQDARASTPCADRLLPAAGASASGKRTITARDLIELRDIGDPESSGFGMPARLAVSPDGRQLAFTLIRASIETNGYCIGVFVMSLDRGAKPKPVSIGGDIRIEADDLRGYVVPSGAIAPTIPAWSPDGRRIAFLRRDNGFTRLWVARADGAGAHPLVTSAVDVDAFRWSGDGRYLLFTTHPRVTEDRRAIQEEGQSGWRYDARVTPDFGAAPLAATPAERSLGKVDVATGRARPLSAVDRRTFPPDATPGVAAPPTAIAGNGWTARTERQGASPLAPTALAVDDPNGKKVPCGAEWCRGGIIGLWWDDTGEALFVLRRQGWNKEDEVLYRWRVGDDPPSIVFRTAEDLQDCVMGREELICTRETATQPRQIVAIAFATGQTRVVFDPNPEFQTIALGRVERLRARNSLGLESWADLVLPPTFRAGDKLPLVIVQYHSDGFLRGGTGDEYPIHLLAARGFAVLSFERPPFVAAAYPNARSAFEINAIILKDWAERRSVFGALSAELDMAIATGAVDPGRIGITGLSDGASTVQFALVNSRRFAAAAVSSCCFEPRSVMTYGGIAFADYLRRMGFPGAIQPNPEFWRPMSIAEASREISTPLLMQLADREYLGALETFTALREAGKPVDLFVFPNEYHVKWQPRHRLAIYQRNLDWFAFWLRAAGDGNAERSIPSEWAAMRANTTVATPGVHP